VGVEKPPICLSTGSGEAELIGMIAKALNEGMLGIESKEELENL
jgi:hypothetical protein